METTLNDGDVIDFTNGKTSRLEPSTTGTETASAVDELNDEPAPTEEGHRCDELPTPVYACSEPAPWQHSIAATYVDGKPTLIKGDAPCGVVHFTDADANQAAMGPAAVAVRNGVTPNHIAQHFGFRPSSGGASCDSPRILPASVGALPSQPFHIASQDTLEQVMRKVDAQVDDIQLTKTRLMQVKVYVCERINTFNLLLQYATSESRPILQNELENWVKLKSILES
jgi:hypothetical protein